jgi:hypothetical protein
MICTRCGKEEQELGASINGKPYCHTFDNKYPTCYMIASRGEKVNEDKTVDGTLYGIPVTVTFKGKPGERTSE